MDDVDDSPESHATFEPGREDLGPSQGKARDSAVRGTRQGALPTTYRGRDRGQQGCNCALCRSTMKTISKRLVKLEERLGLADGKPPFLVVVTYADRSLALDQDRCVEILRECGHLRSGTMCVNLGRVPRGLNAKELESYLRKHGAETCGMQSRTQE